MKGVTVEKQGAEWKVVDDLQMPEPADDQVLVKSIYVAINPVDAYLSQSGILVLGWPLVPGCDAGGIVVKAGKDAISPLGKPFKEGDGVCGCTRLGSRGYSTYEEYFLMDAKCTLPVPDNVSLEEACTLGVGSYTAMLGVFDGLNIPVPDPENLPQPGNEWAMVLGGSSSVGKCAVQLLKAAGFKVLASCSARSFDILKLVGATACVDYKKSPADFAADVREITGGTLTRIFDAVGQNIETFPALLENESKGPKYFSSTNDWTPMPTVPHTRNHAVSLGPVGRPDAVELNNLLHSYIPFIYAMIKAGKLTPAERHIVSGKGGFEDVVDAFQFQQSGKGGSKKVVVKLADP